MYSMAHKQHFLAYKFNKYLQQKTKTLATKWTTFSCYKFHIHKIYAKHSQIERKTNDDKKKVYCNKLQMFRIPNLEKKTNSNFFLSKFNYSYVTIQNYDTKNHKELV
jgi:hypothetical protein